MSFWGRHFSKNFWDRHFDRRRIFSLPGPGPGVPPVPVVYPIGPTGVAAFALLMEPGLTVKYEWQTDVTKVWDGTEVRAELLTLPRETYSGVTILIGATVRRQRAILRRYAHWGEAYRLGLPYDEVSVLSDTALNVVHVSSTDRLDWMTPGQPVIVFSPGDDAFIESWILAFSNSSLTLAHDVSEVAREYGRVMPVMPVLLDTKQGFQRYPRSDDDAVEAWSVSMRSAAFGYRGSPTQAILGVGEAVDPMLSDGVMDGVIYMARDAYLGTPGNLISVSHDGLHAGPVVVTDDLVHHKVLVQYQANLSTVYDILLAINTTSTQIIAGGTYTPTDPVGTGDQFTDKFLHGGVGSVIPFFGRGEVVTTYRGDPIWDRPLTVVSSIVEDSIQSLTTSVDLGGVPLMFGSARQSDWGRQINLTGNLGTEEQWIKAFWMAVHGGQCGFWLPSWRADMVATGVAGGSAGVAATLSLAVAQPSGSGALAGLVATALSLDPDVGNNISIQLQPTAPTSDGRYTEGTTGTSWFVYLEYRPGATTVAQLIARVLADSSLVSLGGGTGATKLQYDDQFGLTIMSGGIATVGARISVDSDDDPGAWRPEYDALQIVQQDGTITHAKITNIDLEDVTSTVYVDTALSGSPIEMLSWIEWVRFEKSSYSIRYDENKFIFSEQARVVQQ